MQIYEMVALRPGARVLIQRTGHAQTETVEIIDTPGPGYAAPTFGFIWVEAGQDGLDGIRQFIVHAREIVGEVKITQP